MKTFRNIQRYVVWKRVMFGITSAPDKYQQVIQKVLKCCSGTANISDDIIIYGPNRAEYESDWRKCSQDWRTGALPLSRRNIWFICQSSHLYDNVQDIQLQPHFLLSNICLGKWSLQMLCHAVQLSKKLGREMLLRTEYTRFGKHRCAKSHDRGGNWGDVWSRWRVREPATMPATMYQDRKLGECKLFRLQVSQRWTLYFWKYGPERNKNSGTKEIWSKSDWVRSWLHQGMLRMKQRCGDQNLIRKPRSFTKHVMGDKLGVDQAVLNLATWLRCL